MTTLTHKTVRSTPETKHAMTIDACRDKSRRLGLGNKVPPHPKKGALKEKYKSNCPFRILICLFFFFLFSKCCVTLVHLPGVKCCADAGRRTPSASGERLVFPHVGQVQAPHALAALLFPRRQTRHAALATALLRARRHSKKGGKCGSAAFS